MGGGINTTQTMKGSYYTDPEGYINIVLPGTRGIIRGALRDDKKVFVGVEIVTPFRQTQDGFVSYHMIYGIKKESHTGDKLIGDYIFNGYSADFTTATDNSGNRMDAYHLGHRVSIGYFKGTNDDGTVWETRNEIDVTSPLSLTYQPVQQVSVAYGGPEDTGPIPIAAEGLWNAPSQAKLWGANLADDSIGILAGATTEPTKTWPDNTITYTKNETKFYLTLKPAQSETWNTANIAGTYTFVYRGDYWEGQSNKLPNNWVMLGRITLDGAGNVSGRVIKSEMGRITIRNVSGLKYEVVQARVGGDPSNQNSGIMVDQVKIYDLSDPTWSIMMFISSDGKCLVPYAPPGTPSNPNHERGLGLAVKQR